MSSSGGPQGFRVQDGSGTAVADVDPYSADNLSAAIEGIVVNARLLGYDGATVDRLLSGVLFNGGVPSGALNTLPAVFRGAGVAGALRASSATHLALLSSVDGVLVAMPGEWSVTHAPAAATQAVASRAAGGAGVRHVVTGGTIVISGGPAAPAAQTITVHLRDGATGAGTILKTWTIGVEAVAGRTTVITFRCNVVGTANTAMTLETSAAPGANTLASVELNGYDAS